MPHSRTMTSPDEMGLFGEFGGQEVPPPLKAAMDEVAAAYLDARKDPSFLEQMDSLLSDYVGRPSPLYFAENLTKKLGGAKIYLKREDLNHTGAHKINHTLGEALLAKRMGKKRVIAETGAGQHGVALATAAAIAGLSCDIYMGEIDIAKQHPNVVRMKLLGAAVHPVSAGGKSLKDAVDAAIGAYLDDVENSFFAIGSVVGPHPYPMMIQEFQSVVGREAKRQITDKEGRLPDILMACVGGGSNAMGLFHEFLNDPVRMIGVEPAGRGSGRGEHAATLTFGRPGTIHGMRTLLLQDEDGTPQPVHSIASGLDYPGIGPMHAHLKATGRVEYVTAGDEEALSAFRELSSVEGIIPALESAHAVAHAMEIAPSLPADSIVLVNLSGRGDKDLDFAAELLGWSRGGV
ncbi:MAG TPA: tryptophan synthase subunit beta [bacterium]|nr:tryptophan synthase subunit beta [bacterium]